jgi:hypothetical protein
MDALMIMSDEAEGAIIAGLEIMVDDTGLTFM